MLSGLRELGNGYLIIGSLVGTANFDKAERQMGLRVSQQM